MSLFTSNNPSYNLTCFDGKDANRIWPSRLNLIHSFIKNSAVICIVMIAIEGDFIKLINARVDPNRRTLVALPPSTPSYIISRACQLLPPSWSLPPLPLPYIPRWFWELPPSSVPGIASPVLPCTPSPSPVSNSNSETQKHRLGVKFPAFFLLLSDVSDSWLEQKMGGGVKARGWLTGWRNCTHVFKFNTTWHLQAPIDAARICYMLFQRGWL